MRHITRHVHQTLLDHAASALASQGWTGATPPYGATKVTLEGVTPTEPQDVAPNTVMLSLEFPGPEDDAEMGGGLVNVQYTLFVDVFGENQSTTQAILDDLRLAFSRLNLAVTDYTAATPVSTNHWIEIDHVSVEEPPAAGQVQRTHWRVLSGPIDVFLLGGIL